MLSADKINELGILSIVDVSAERDLANGQSSRDRVAFDTDDLVGLAHDVLCGRYKRQQ